MPSSTILFCSDSLTLPSLHLLYRTVQNPILTFPLYLHPSQRPLLYSSEITSFQSGNFQMNLKNPHPLVSHCPQSHPCSGSCVRHCPRRDQCLLVFATTHTLPSFLTDPPRYKPPTHCILLPSIIFRLRPPPPPYRGTLTLRINSPPPSVSTLPPSSARFPLLI
jgi:hypothetical protein